MAIEFLINRLKAVFVLLLGAFKRALCCLRRRRRSSCDSVPLSAVGVVPSVVNSSGDSDQWEHWEENPVIVIPDKPPNIIQTKIEQYRQQISNPAIPPDENSLNFFKDMTPKITKHSSAH